MIRTAIDEIAVLRRQNDLLSARVAYLEGKLSILGDDCPKAWKLSKSEARIMGLLVRAAGRVIQRQTLISGLWDTAEPETAARVIDVFIMRIRRKVAPFGVTIRTVWGTGFCVEHDQTDMQASQ